MKNSFKKAGLPASVSINRILILDSIQPQEEGRNHDVPSTDGKNPTWYFKLSVLCTETRRFKDFAVV